MRVFLQSKCSSVGLLTKVNPGKVKKRERKKKGSPSNYGEKQAETELKTTHMIHPQRTTPDTEQGNPGL